MKLASYNVENLFQRAKALNLATWDEGRDVLHWQAELNRVLGKAKYTSADKKKIIDLMKKLKIDKKDDSGPFVILRQNRGDLVKRPKAGPIEIVADGRNSWIGWVDFKYEEVDEVATRNTAQVIRDIDADVLGVVEAENRPSLVRFSDNVIKAVGGAPYDHVMLIDGNDDRGIDVAVMTRENYPIVSISSHVDDADGGSRIFSRDCAQFEIRTAKGNPLFVLVNHLKSKGFGLKAASDARRERQACRVKEIYDELIGKHKFVAIIGDMNDTPASAPLAALMEDPTLKDISAHAKFDDGGRPGTFGNGTASNKIDYILLSPELFARAKGGGIFRMGLWGGKNGTLFPHYPEINKASEAASDHAAIWAEIDV